MIDNDLLRAMTLIRAFEDHLVSLPNPGFQLLSSGEEAVAVGVVQRSSRAISSSRAVAPSARRSRAGSTRASCSPSSSENAADPTGKGRARALSQPSVGFFGAHAVVGGNLTVAAGVALAQQQLATGAVVVVMFGDGACGAGTLHETLNIAALWKLPLVLVCNNNQYSVSTRVVDGVAARALADLADPFGIPSSTVDGMDVLAVREAARTAVSRARAGDGPTFIECLSYRFHQHSTSSKESRPREEVEQWRSRCPIARFALHAGLDAAAARQDVGAAVAEASRFAEASPFPEGVEALEDVG